MLWNTKYNVPMGSHVRKRSWLWYWHGRGVTTKLFGTDSRAVCGYFKSIEGLGCHWLPGTALGRNPVAGKAL